MAVQAQVVGTSTRVPSGSGASAPAPAACSLSLCAKTLAGSAPRSAPMEARLERGGRAVNVRKVGQDGGALLPAAPQK